MTQTGSRDTSEVVDILLVLADSELDGEAVNRYWRLCVLRQPPAAIPVLMVLLRRKDSEVAWSYADDMVDEILGRGKLRGVPRKDLTGVAKALRAATLNKDADKLLEGVGKNTWGLTAIEVAAEFPDEIPGDREKILKAVASGGSNHLVRAIEAMNKTPVNGIDPKKTLDRMIFGIPWGKHKEFSEALEKEGLHYEAQRVLELENEPPF